MPILSDFDAAFEREYGCTDAEWQGWLPGAVREHALSLGTAEARVAIGEGHLQLNWQQLPPRQIALMRLPRLGVRFQFEGVDEAVRQQFMRYFDLYMQRGGG